MKIIISPTKTFDFSKSIKQEKNEIPKFIKEANFLNDLLSKIDDISSFFKCSEKISIDVLKYINDFKNNNTREAIFSYSGTVFKHINPYNMNNDDLEFLQKNLFILSGMYGVLTPLDNISKYRLEMKQKLINFDRGLYGFWSDKISKYLKSQIEKNEVLLNLSSTEYFKVIDKKILNRKIMSVEFKENIDGKLKIIGIYAKQARGDMVNFIVKNKITKITDIKLFNYNKYSYNDNLSNDKKIIFLR